MGKKLAVVTMVYNEPEFLPIWCGYYGKQAGSEHCYIIDHGSDDGSTGKLVGFNVVKIPRSPKDNERRTRFVSQFCSALLEWYDVIINVDVDEIVVAEPDRFRNLQEYVDREEREVINAIGFDLHHLPLLEGPLDLANPVFKQRKWVRFSSAMCKPVLTTRPLTWAPGFHSANAPISFGQLYLFHLRYFDLALGLERLRRTRSMEWFREDAGKHQRVQDSEFTSLMMSVARLSRIEECSFLPEAKPIVDYIQGLLKSEKPLGVSPYNIDLTVSGDKLIEMPIKFGASL